jgi:hypothetical protein
VRIVVNHLTRMTDRRICAAGVDVESYRHVRPVTGLESPLTRTLLCENGGPLGVGALVDLGAVKARPTRPQTEDHEFRPRRARRVRDVTAEEYLELLGAISHQDVETAFGPDLVAIRPRKLAVPAEHGNRSLAVVPLVEARLRIKYEKLYLVLSPPMIAAEIRVTDIRFYDGDLKIRGDVVKDVNRRLAVGVKAYAMLGLARAILDGDRDESVHWLMANGICLADRAVGETP